MRKPTGLGGFKHCHCLYVCVKPRKVTDAIIQLKIPMSRNPLGKTFSYLLKESRTLIDTGVPTEEAWNGLRTQLKQYGLQPQDIERVILTHLHTDHIGLVESMREKGIEIWAGDKAMERQEMMVEEWTNLYEHTLRELDLFGGQQYKNIVRRNRNAFPREIEPTPIDRYLGDGERINLGDLELRVIWTPGHSYEHICLLNQEDHILFSGDHVLPKITSHVALHSYRDHNPLGEYIQSLEKVKNLDVDTILPGHEWMFHSLKTRVEELKTHHNNRLNEMRETLKDGPQTVYDVGSKVHWDSRPWPKMSFWTKRMAATETYAHLFYLMKLGEVKRETRQGSWFFTEK